MCYLWDFYALLQQIGLLWRGPLLKLFKLPISDSFSSIEDFTFISPLPVFMESCSSGFWDFLASLGDFWVTLVFLVLFLPFFIWTDFDYWLTTCPLDLKTFGKMKNRLSYWLTFWTLFRQALRRLELPSLQEEGFLEQPNQRLRLLVPQRKRLQALVASAQVWSLFSIELKLQQLLQLVFL